MVPPALSIHRQKEGMMNRTLAGKGICTGGHVLNSCARGEWEWGRNWQGSCSILHWQCPVLCVCERLTPQVSLFLASPAEMDGRGGHQPDNLQVWSGNQMDNLGVWHRLGDRWFGLVILQINTASWCVAVMGIARYQWVMVCLAAHGDWGSTAGLVSKD